MGHRCCAGPESARPANVSTKSGAEFGPILARLASMHQPRRGKLKKKKPSAA
jgi:hypothetical protein